jgi:hypothetical protein
LAIIFHSGKLWHLVAVRSVWLLRQSRAIRGCGARASVPIAVVATSKEQKHLAAANIKVARITSVSGMEQLALSEGGALSAAHVGRLPSSICPHGPRRATEPLRDDRGRGHGRASARADSRRRQDLHATSVRRRRTPTRRDDDGIDNPQVHKRHSIFPIEYIVKPP